jgi:hypothetical protein
MVVIVWLPASANAAVATTAATATAPTPDQSLIRTVFGRMIRRLPER